METWISRYLMAVAGLALVLLLVSAAAAQARPASLEFSTAPFLTPVTDRCIFLARDRGREVLVNRCGVCITVGLVRERRSGAPQSRRYNVQKGSTFPLPFKGPGLTRVKSKLPCDGEQGAAPNLADDGALEKAPETCVSIKRTNAGVVLRNECRSCRIAGVERFNSRRQSLGREYVKVDRNDVLVRQRGAAQVGLLGDLECPLALRKN